MSFKLLLFSSFLVLVTSLTPGVYFPKRDGLIYLTDDTFEEASREYEYLYVTMDSQNCLDCKKLILSMVEAEKIINEKEPELKGRVAFCQITGYYNYDFLKQFSIMGYPNVVLIKDMKRIGLVPDRYSPKDLIIYLRKKILVPVQLINNKHHYDLLVDEAMDHGEKVITYYGKDKNVIQNLGKVQNNYNYYTFINIQNEELIKELNKTEGQLSFNKNFDEAQVTEDSLDNENWTKEKILFFIQKYNHKIMLKFDDYDGRKLLEKKTDILLLVLKPKETEDNNNEEKNKKEDENNKKYLRNDNEERNKYALKIKELYKNENNLHFYELAKSVRGIIQSSKIFFNQEILNKKKEEKKPKDPRRRRFGRDEDDDGGFFGSRRKEVDSINKKQNLFVSKILNKNELECEIKLININKMEDPIYYTLPCGKENIENNIQFIKDWKNNKLPKDTPVGEIDPDELIFEAPKQRQMF